MSVIVRSKYMNKQQEKALIDNLTESLHPDELYVEHDFSIIMLVGEDMKEHAGVAARASRALAVHGISIA